MAGIDMSGLSSSLFGTQSSSSGSGTGIAGLSSEFASIKNGSYGKLLKNYYAQESGSAEKTELTDAQKLNLSSVRQKADALEKSIGKLMDESLFAKKSMVEKNEETGETTETFDYDRKAIAEAVQSFAKDYNALLDELGKSEDKNVLQKAVWMIGMTNTMQTVLNDAGITVGSDNKLSVDESKLNGVGISTLTTLFQGRNSFAAKVLQKATGISAEAARAAANDKITYGKSGDLSDALNAGLLYDTKSE